MSAELKLKLEEPATPPPLPTVMPPPVPQAATALGADPGAEETDPAQSMSKGIIGGAVAALIAAILWAVMTALTKWQIGWMAVGVGALVGLGVRKLGRGTSSKFGFVGATLALGGCLVGNFLAYCMIAASEMDIGLGAALLSIAKEPGTILEIMYAGFGPMDFLFYAIALYEGYRFSFCNVANEY